MADQDLALRAAEAALTDAQALQRAGDTSAAFAKIEHAVALKPDEPGVLYVSGVFAHGLGRLHVARAFLQEARRLAPAAPEVAFALGNLRLEESAAGSAEALFREALDLSPNFADARRGLSSALCRQGRYDDAEVELQALDSAGMLSPEAAVDLATIRLRRDDPGVRSILYRIVAQAPAFSRAHFVLADLYRRLGNVGQAVAVYRRTLAIDGQNPGAWQGLGLTGVAAGSMRTAAAALRRALTLGPSDPVAWYALGEAHRGEESWRGAATSYRRTLAADPGRTDALIHLGNALDELDERGAAVGVLRTALDGAPTNVMALSNLATVLLQDGHIGAVTGLYRQAVALEPGNPVAQYNLANAFRQSLDLAAALSRYGRATDLDPLYATAHLNGAIARLTAGDWGRGFREYEWRWRDRRSRLPDYARPWHGEAIRGRRIVLLGEQGFGDMIHFVRYALLIRQQGAHVVLECYPELRRLFSTLADDIELVDMGTHPGAVDFQAALMQLPLIFSAAPEVTFAPARYLAPPTGGPALPRPATGIKVGFVWAGNPRIEKFHKRSASLEAFLPLIEMPGVAAYSLQVGPRAADVVRLGLSGRLVDLAPLVSDFADTAALIDQLDLVVAVDTAAAHLAGALGKKVWMLPTHVPDWRWMLNRDDTPWYPSMRLYRQGPDRTWPPVVARIARDLAALVSS